MPKTFFGGRASKLLLLTFRSSAKVICELGFNQKSIPIRDTHAPNQRAQSSPILSKAQTKKGAGQILMKW